MGRPIRITVNGIERKLEVEPNRFLLEVLRDDLGLTGTKEGCSIGVCGACTVLLNGKIVSSCLTLAVAADGAEITTVEGISPNGELHPVQEEFVNKGALQCGFCTPGQIVAAKALLDENPHPSAGEVKEWMTGNLCRCTGYYKIIDAIIAASEH